jgi:hypothetical protein
MRQAVSKGGSTKTLGRELKVARPWVLNGAFKCVKNLTNYHIKYAKLPSEIART